MVFANDLIILRALEFTEIKQATDKIWEERLNIEKLQN